MAEGRKTLAELITLMGVAGEGVISAEDVRCLMLSKMQSAVLLGYSTISGGTAFNATSWTKITSPALSTYYTTLGSQSNNNIEGSRAGGDGIYLCFCSICAYTIVNGFEFEIWRNDVQTNTRSHGIMMVAESHQEDPSTFKTCCLER
jgi:hypothetical protein